MAAAGTSPPRASRRLAFSISGGECRTAQRRRPFRDDDLDAAVVGAVAGNFGGSDEEYYSVGGKYLFSEEMPVSLFAACTYSDYSSNYHVSAINVGVRLYLNGDGVSTLVDRQHTGET